MITYLRRETVDIFGCVATKFSVSVPSENNTIHTKNGLIYNEQAKFTNFRI